MDTPARAAPLEEGDARTPTKSALDPASGTARGHDQENLDQRLYHVYQRMDEYQTRLRPIADSDLPDSARWAKRGSTTPLLNYAVVLPIAGAEVLQRSKQLWKECGEADEDPLSSEDDEDSILAIDDILDHIHSLLPPTVELKWARTLVAGDPRTYRQHPTCGMLKMFSNQDSEAKRAPYLENMGEILRLIKESFGIHNADLVPMWHFDSDLYGFDDNYIFTVDEMLKFRKVDLNSLVRQEGSSRDIVRATCRCCACLLAADT
ncbi:hypothetical protein OH77DRAFT_1429616 [Trametes cingulata]|nr:hypothetical protein OH77DRAFT_1429616 [Trametes cingulata]